MVCAKLQTHKVTVPESGICYHKEFQINSSAGSGEKYDSTYNPSTYMTKYSPVIKLGPMNSPNQNKMLPNTSLPLNTLHLVMAANGIWLS